MKTFVDEINNLEFTEDNKNITITYPGVDGYILGTAERRSRQSLKAFARAYIAEHPPLGKTAHYELLRDVNVLEEAQGIPEQDRITEYADAEHIYLKNGATPQLAAKRLKDQLNMNAFEHISVAEQLGADEREEQAHPVEPDTEFYGIIEFLNPNGTVGETLLYDNQKEYDGERRDSQHVGRPIRAQRISFDEYRAKMMAMDDARMEIPDAPGKGVTPFFGKLEYNHPVENGNQYRIFNDYDQYNKAYATDLETGALVQAHIISEEEYFALKHSTVNWKDVLHKADIIGEWESANSIPEAQCITQWYGDQGIYEPKMNNLSADLSFDKARVQMAERILQKYDDIIREPANAPDVAQHEPTKSAQSQAENHMNSLEFNQRFPYLSYEDCGYIQNNAAGDVSFITTADQFKLMGYEIGEDETPLHPASVKGELYDISQTNCPEAERLVFAMPAIATAEPAEKYEQISLFAERCGMQVIETELDGAAGRYDAHNNTICISADPQMDINLKLDALCSAYADGLVEATSTQPPEIRQLDKSALYISTCLYMGMPVDGSAQQQLENAIERAQVHRSHKMDSMLRRCHNMLGMMAEKMEAGAFAMEPSRLQSAAPSMDMEATRADAQDISENFMVGI